MTLTPPTRNPNGVNNVPYKAAFNMLPVPDPTLVVSMYDDFTGFLAGTPWTTVAPNSGAIALIAGSGGVLGFTTGATSGNTASIQTANAWLYFGSDNNTASPSYGGIFGAAWFRAVFKTPANVGTQNFTMGLCNTSISTTSLVLTDGVYITKPIGTTTLTITAGCAAQNTVTGSLGVANVNYALANSTWYDIGFWIDLQVGNIYSWATTTVGRGIPVLTAGLTNLGTAGATSGVNGIGSITKIGLTPTFAIQTFSAAATSGALDLIDAAVTRNVLPEP
jgi:hypothetical protein